MGRDRCCRRTSDAQGFENALGAGDLLPTFVTPADAKAYIDEIDAKYVRINGTITRSNVSPDFKISWGIQFTNWKVFAGTSRAGVGWLDTKAVMDQTDRYGAELTNWRGAFLQAGGTDEGPAPIAPGQGTSKALELKDITGLIVAGGAVVTILVFLPQLLRK